MRAVLVVTAIALLVSSVDAQRRGFGRQRSPNENGKNHSSVTGAYKEVVAKARLSTVQVKCGDFNVALGTVVGANGFVVTKTSRLDMDQGKITVTLHDGRTLAAKRLGNHYDNDLVLLKVAATDLVPVNWSKDVGASVGSFLASPGMQELPIATGVMGNKVHDRKREKFRRRTRSRNNSNSRTGRRRRSSPPTTPGFLGMFAVMQGDRVKIDEVMPETPAAAAGLLAGDLVLQFDGRTIRDHDEFVTRISRAGAGKQVKLKVRRGSKEVELTPTLGKNPNPKEDRRGPLSSRQAYWGPLSDVRIGYTEVIQHDSVLKPAQCGGPIVNLDGEVIGINIARVGRIESLALTGRVVREMLPKLRQPGTIGRSLPKAAATKKVEAKPKADATKKK